MYVSSCVSRSKHHLSPHQRAHREGAAADTWPCALLFWKTRQLKDTLTLYHTHTCTQIIFFSMRQDLADTLSVWHSSHKKRYFSLGTRNSTEDNYLHIKCKAWSYGPNGGVLWTLSQFCEWHLISSCLCDTQSAHVLQRVCIAVWSVCIVVVNGWPNKFTMHLSVSVYRLMLYKTSCYVTNFILQIKTFNAINLKLEYLMIIIQHK